MTRNKYSMYAHNVVKFISRFPDLKYDGCMVICVVCNKHLICWKASMCEQHVASASHKRNRKNQIPYATFLFELYFMLAVCNIPFNIMHKPPFRQFWGKHNPTWKLPSQSTLYRYKPHVRKRIENDITQTLRNKKLWITVDETTDSRGNSVAHVVVRILNPLAPTAPYLLASKQLQQCTGEEIKKLILSTLHKFRIDTNQVLMLVTDGAASMLLAGHLLKSTLPNLVHVTCILHTLHLVSEAIRKCYPDVDLLITNTKAVFHKSPKRTRLFHKHCPNIPEPPQPIFTRWETWLDAALYYHKYFECIKSLVLQFDFNESAGIIESQQQFQNAQVEEDLQSIHNNYSVVRDAITTLQTKSLSLAESLQLVYQVDTVLQTLSDSSGVRAMEKFKSALSKNPDLARLSNFHKMCKPPDTLNNLEQYFLFANITSLDVERSFSLYKNIFSPLRSSLNEDSVELYAMLQMFSRANPQYLSKNQ